MTTMRVIGTQLYQWEIGRQVQVFPILGMKINRVEFSNFGDSEALCVEPKEENGMIIADIPNILLQSGRKVVAYSVNVSQDCCETVWECVFSVRPRPKPSDYVYTETEILEYRTLSKRIDEIEKNGVSDAQIATAVEKYLDENPINCLPEVTAEDDGKILRVIGGEWAAAELPVYSGEYAITPTVDGQTLETAQKLMTDNLTVKQIPFFDVGNNSGGSTVYIGTEIEIE